jgi:hypothetical protein
VNTRTRRLIVALLAVVVVAAMVVVDIVTLTKAKPSFDNETRAFNKLLHSEPTTSLPTAHLPASPTTAHLPASPTTAHLPAPPTTTPR